MQEFKGLKKLKDDNILGLPKKPMLKFQKFNSKGEGCAYVKMNQHCIFEYWISKVIPITY